MNYWDDLLETEVDKNKKQSFLDKIAKKMRFTRQSSNTSLRVQLSLSRLNRKYYAPFYKEHLSLADKINISLKIKRELSIICVPDYSGSMSDEEVSKLSNILDNFSNNNNSYNRRKNLI